MDSSQSDSLSDRLSFRAHSPADAAASILDAYLPGMDESTGEQRHEFTTQSSELLEDCPIIALRRDEVTMPGGHCASREIVEHFGAAAIVAISGDRSNWDSLKVLLVHQYRHSVGRRLWELPAGLLDSWGEDPLTAAKRELQEETGCSAGQWSLLTDVVSSPGFCDEAVRIFVASDLSEGKRPDADDEEADMVSAWVRLEDAFSAVLAGEISNSTAVAGICAAYAALKNSSALRSTECEFDLRPMSLASRRARQLRDAGQSTDDLKKRV